MHNFHFVNKTPQSNVLSRSEDEERTGVYRHVQRSNSNLRDAASQRGKSSYRRRSSGRAGRRALQQHTTNFIHFETRLTPSPGENRTVYAHRLLGAFIDQNLYTLANQIDHLDIQSFFWIRNLQALLALGDSALRAGIIALAAAGLGQAYQDRHLIHGAEAAYDKAVTLLSTISLLANDQAFAACYSLVMYQYFAQSPDRRQLFLHMRGLSAILQTRGPHDFREGLAHELFTSCRAVLIASSLHARKASFVAEVEWRITPWQVRPKSSYEQMMDCLSIIPQVAQDFYMAQQGGESAFSSERHFAVVGQLWEAVSMIHGWFLTVANAARPTRLVYTHLPSLIDVSPQVAAFPRSYAYHSLAKSNMCRLFWTALTDLYNMLCLTYEALAAQGVYNVSLEPVRQRCQGCTTHSTDAEATAVTHESHEFCTAGAVGIYISSPPLLDIDMCNSVMLAFACRRFALLAAEQVCMSLQFCILPEHGSVGKYLSIIPLKFVVWCFSINQTATAHQLEWVRRAIDALAKSGIPFTNRLFHDKPYIVDESYLFKEEK